MEDVIAYFILAVVIVWFCHKIYKKITMTDNCGCDSGCANCDSSDGHCNDNPFDMEEK